MKKALLLITLMLGCMNVFAQKVDKAEINKLKTFLAQTSEKGGTNAAALNIVMQCVRPHRGAGQA